MVVAAKNHHEEIVGSEKNELDVQKLLNNPEFLKSFSALLKTNLSENSKEQTKERIVTSIVGNDKAIQYNLNFGDGKTRSWIVRDHKDVEVTKFVDVDAQGCEKVVLKNIFSNGSRSIIVVEPEGDDHTCLFLDENQRIRIIYIKGKVEILVDHTIDMKGWSTNGIKYNVKGKICTDKLFGDEFDMKEDERHCSDGYGSDDQLRLLKALPAAKALFFGA